MEAKNPETQEPDDYGVSLFELQARFARVMGNPARLQILHALVEAEGSELATSEILEQTGSARAPSHSTSRR
jgi:DNA-binding transcriptional ArsR family regulator